MVIDYLNDAEMRICCRINGFGRRAAIRRLFAVVSRLGDWSFWAMTAVLLAALHGRAIVPGLVHATLTAIVGILVYKALKSTLVRERPYIASRDILCGTPPLDRYSFPSGHTLHAVSFTLLFAHLEPASIVFCGPFAALVGASRVVLGLHYPSDVLAGAAIGAGLATVSVGLM